MTLSHLFDNFPHLITKADDIPKLNEAILQLAVQGRLVPQNPNDEPASVLLERIQSEKARLEEEGKIRKSKPLPSPKSDKNIFELPSEWALCRLGEIGDWGAGATPHRQKHEYYDSGTTPWLKTGELNDGYINSSEEFITDLALKEASLSLDFAP